jgi:hypothetical protein
MFLKRNLLVCAALLFAAGCADVRGWDFTAISTKNVYAKNVNISRLPQTQGVEGEKLYFLGIGENIKDPLDIALEKGHGNLMIDAVVYYKAVFLFSGFRVRGTVVNVPYYGSAPARVSAAN